MQELISIVIPVYNSEEYLEVCIKSLIHQTYDELEIIFVNDCSKDKSLEILKKYQNKDSRIKIINNKLNQGVSESRNIGIKYATGKYIGFCDSDDSCDLSMYENMHNSLTKNDAQIACCGIRRIKTNGQQYTLWESDRELLFSTEEAMKCWFEGKYIGSSVYSKLFKANLWENVKFPKGEIFEEAAVLPELFLNADKIVHCGNTLYNYFERENSYTTSNFSKKKLIVISRLKSIESKIKNEYPELFDSFLVYKIRNITGLKTGIELEREMLDQGILKEVDKSFNQIFFNALLNDKLSKKEKIQIIELKTKLFYLRKKLTRILCK